jgi:hypothetical protein
LVKKVNRDAVLEFIEQKSSIFENNCPMIRNSESDRCGITIGQPVLHTEKKS